jgi:hypothetical protein
MVRPYKVEVRGGTPPLERVMVDWNKPLPQYCSCSWVPMPYFEDRRWKYPRRIKYLHSGCSIHLELFYPAYVAAQTSPTMEYPTRWEGPTVGDNTRIATRSRGRPRKETS